MKLNPLALILMLFTTASGYVLVEESTRGALSGFIIGSGLVIVASILRK